MNRAVKAASIAALATAYGLMPAGADAPVTGAELEIVSDSDTGAVAALAGASAAVSWRITIRGHVADSAGRAVPAAQMFLEGTRRDVAPLDRNGSYVLDVPVGPLESLIREPLSLWLNARRTGWRIGLASGAARLRIELGVYDDSLGARHVRVRTNDPAVTAALAGAFAAGELVAPLQVGFIGEPGKDPEPRDVAPDAEADIVVVPGRVTSYATPDITEAPPSGAAPKPVVATTRGTPPDVAPAALDSCTCRIEGTIEVQWNRPLPEPVPVALWVQGNPAGRDSVELLLGSPRGFVLLATGCGAHRVVYKAYSRLKFTRLTPDPVIECSDQGLRQLRIVLEPVRPHFPR